MTRWVSRSGRGYVPPDGIVRRHPVGMSAAEVERFEELAGYGEDEGLAPREAEERAANMMERKGGRDG